MISIKKFEEDQRIQEAANWKIATKICENFSSTRNTQKEKKKIEKLSC